MYVYNYNRSLGPKFEEKYFNITKSSLNVYLLKRMYSKYSVSLHSSVKPTTSWEKYQHFHLN